MAVLKPYKRRQILEAIFAAKRWAQGNQKHDHTTNNGSEACTHVAWLQAGIYLWTGLDVTIDEISHITGYVRGSGGMNSSHVDKAIAHWKLPYEATWRTKAPNGIVGGWTARDLEKTAREVGPVMVAVGYSLYPLDKDLLGSDHEMNGYAIQGGRVDTNFTGIHAVLMFTARWRPALKQYRPRVLDPDHGFPSHPRVPRFDILTEVTFERMWNADLPGKNYGQVGYVPTRPWNGLPATATP